MSRASWTVCWSTVTRWLLSRSGACCGVSDAAGSCAGECVLIVQHHQQQRHWALRPARDRLSCGSAAEVVSLDLMWQSGCDVTVLSAFCWTPS